LTEGPRLLPVIGRAAAEGGIGLRDRQERTVDYLRVSLTDRCNYRCTYCMPAEGVALLPKPRILTFEELERIVRCFVSLGVRRVRLTGGEPTIRRELPALVARLAAIEGLDEIMMTTNGELLAELAQPLRDAGLSRLNISVDSLDPDRFRSITRRGDLGRVLAGVEAALAAGFPVKINTVAIRGFNEDELGRLCSWAWSIGAVPRFIEIMPMSEGDLFVPGELLPAADIRAGIAAAFPGARLVPARSALPGAGPARYLRLEGWGENPAHGREVGIISAITENFCDTCNRVRLNAIGELHSCLAYDDATDLRRALLLHGEEGVVKAIAQTLGTKRDGHTFQSTGCGGPQKAMVSIGG
jgi:cyclic pyranopterin phosphate synthase